LKSSINNRLYLNYYNLAAPSFLGLTLKNVLVPIFDVSPLKESFVFALVQVWRKLLSDKSRTLKVFEFDFRSISPTDALHGLFG
jgi:hypothetical protein